MTTAVCIAAVILLLVYDLFALLKGGYQNTVSAVVLKAGKRYPIIPFLLGIVCGHLFWVNAP